MTLIRNSKKSFYDGISNKLKSNKLSSRDCGPYLRELFHRPPTLLFLLLKVMEIYIYTDEIDKANILNQFFQSQTFLNEQNATIPDLIPYETNSFLNLINLTPIDVHSIVNQLPLGNGIVTE